MQKTFVCTTPPFIRLLPSCPNASEGLSTLPEGPSGSSGGGNKKLKGLFHDRKGPINKYDGIPPASTKMASSEPHLLTIHDVDAFRQISDTATAHVINGLIIRLSGIHINDGRCILHRHRE